MQNEHLDKNLKVLQTIEREVEKDRTAAPAPPAARSATQERLSKELEEQKRGLAY